MNIEEFGCAVEALGLDWSGIQAVAVAVSGGPDSMALCALLKGWADARGVEVHALSVDHGLRAEGAQEAAQVGEWLESWSGFRHEVLRWGDPAETAVQEEARRARYALMAEYCTKHKISHLFLGHHRDDQAETVLFRLAKGSGLDGLAGMRSVQKYDGGLKLLRPLLGVSKEDLISFCADEKISYIEDPSNKNDDFARIRLREAREVLEAEGLSSKRLSVTASRLLRAKKALDFIAGEVYKEALVDNNTKQIVLNFKILKSQPDEIALRCVLLALSNLRPEADYSPRMEKVEALVSDCMRSDAFRKRTLGGVIFERDDKAGTLCMMKE